MSAGGASGSELVLTVYRDGHFQSSGMLIHPRYCAVGPAFVSLPGFSSMSSGQRPALPAQFCASSVGMHAPVEVWQT